MSKRTYNWKRYWCPREGQLWLLDDGFLVDPTSEAARYYKSDVVDFESIASKPCLVLLGEPGIGKSTALEREYAAVRRTVAGNGDSILRFDLGEYSTGEQLSRKVFCSPKIQKWRRSTTYFTSSSTAWTSLGSGSTTSAPCCARNCAIFHRIGCGSG